LFLLSLDKKKQELAGWVIFIVPSAPFYCPPIVASLFISPPISFVRKERIGSMFKEKKCCNIFFP
jgi:membrane glycosyltransferase